MNSANLSAQLGTNKKNSKDNCARIRGQPGPSVFRVYLVSPIPVGRGLLIDADGCFRSFALTEKDGAF